MVDLTELKRLLLGPGPVLAAEEVVVYKSPTCGCCKNWIAHMKANGFGGEYLEGFRQI